MNIRLLRKLTLLISLITGASLSVLPALAQNIDGIENLNERVVLFQNGTCAPANLTIEEGQGITWTNMDTVNPITLIGVGEDFPVAPQEIPFNQGFYSIVFDEPGTYEYYCVSNPTKGVITVRDTTPTVTAETQEEEDDELPRSGNLNANITNLLEEESTATQENFSSTYVCSEFDDQGFCMDYDRLTIDELINSPNLDQSVFEFYLDSAEPVSTQSNNQNPLNNVLQFLNNQTSGNGQSGFSTSQDNNAENFSCFEYDLYGNCI